MKGAVVRLLLIFVVFSSSCNNVDDAQRLIEIKSNETGRSLFKELFFGDVATSSLSYVKDLSSMRNKLPENELQKVRLIEASILKTIELNYPYFFEEFYEKITSGNHLFIEEALENETQKIRDSVLSSPDLAKKILLREKLASEIDLAKLSDVNGRLDLEMLNKYLEEEGLITEPMACGPTFCVLGVYIVGGISVALAVNYALAVNIYVWFNFATEVNAINGIQSVDGFNSQLSKEIFINEISILYSEKS